jgi:crotonobetainyl-CoA:carnitine CoA-transferase CaiB-like acyl-CoA transferase
MLSCYKVLDLSDKTGWLAGKILADLGADVIKIEALDSDLSDTDWRAFNIGKRLLRLDIGRGAGRRVLDKMIGNADILVETAAPSGADDLMAPKRLAALNPELIHVSITPFGHNGPRAHWRGTDIEVMAASGAMSLVGEPEGTPLRISVPQSGLWAGAQAAVGALIAISCRTMGNCGGQHVDVSAQASVLAALAHAPTFFDLLGTVPTRAGSHISGRSVEGAVFRAFWRCRDGYINFVVYGGPAGRRTNKALVAWMRETNADLGVLGEIDWDTFDPTRAAQEEVDRIELPIAKFLKGLTKAEFLDGAFLREMLGYPVSTVADIARDPQLEARDFWHDVDTPDGGRERHCGVFYVRDGVRPPLRETLHAAHAMENILDDFGISE